MATRSFRVARQRGEELARPSGPPWKETGVGTRATAIAHPSSVLRAGRGEKEARDRALDDLVSDLHVVRGLLPH